MAPKYSISSPLEAGTSILLDGRTLPSHVYPALEYISEKLAKKDVHMTLVIVRRDYQLPAKASSGVLNRSTSATLPPAASSVPAPFGRTKPGNSGFSLTKIKHKLRTNTFPLAGLASNHAVQDRTVVVYPASEEGSRTGIASPAFSVSPTSSMASTVSTASTVESNNGSYCAWPLSPTSPYSATMPATPATPLSDVSMGTHTTTDASSVVSGMEGRVACNDLGFRLVHTSPVSSKEERLLEQTTQKAERKFHLGYVAGQLAPGPWPLPKICLLIVRFQTKLVSPSCCSFRMQPHCRSDTPISGAERADILLQRPLLIDVGPPIYIQVGNLCLRSHTVDMQA